MFLSRLLHCGPIAAILLLGLFSLIISSIFTGQVFLIRKIET